MNSAISYNEVFNRQFSLIEGIFPEPSIVESDDFIFHLHF